MTTNTDYGFDISKYIEDLDKVEYNELWKPSKDEYNEEKLKDILQRTNVINNEIHRKEKIKFLEESYMKEEDILNTMGKIQNPSDDDFLGFDNEENNYEEW